MTDTGGTGGEEETRRPSFHLSEKHRRESYEIEDARWAARKQVRDWVMILIMMILTLAFAVSVAFFEPGLGSLGR